MPSALQLHTQDTPPSAEHSQEPFEQVVEQPHDFAANPLDGKNMSPPPTSNSQVNRRTCFMCASRVMVKSLTQPGDVQRAK